MGEAPPAGSMTAAEYLAWEAGQMEKHEYVRGEVFSVGGASRRRVTVSGNLFLELAQVLADGPCRVYMADMKLALEADTAYFYPDVLVTCDPDDHRADQVMRRPLLVVEVLSPSTAANDRGEKASAYRSLPSLREFVLVDPERQTVELYQRQEENVWQLRDVRPGQSLLLSSLELEIPWQRIFRNVD
ncbi:MAG: Uma2 family endonuclease [Thermodesulfobacteriota bacterium]